MAEPGSAAESSGGWEAGSRWRPWRAGTAGSRWSAILTEQGGVGAENTIEVSIGGEFTPDLERPYRRPLRFGARYGVLPFPLIPGTHPREYGVSVGSGMRFAQRRAGIDLALEHVWRSEGVYSERGFVLTVGVSVRP